MSSPDFWFLSYMLAWISVCSLKSVIQVLCWFIAGYRPAWLSKMIYYIVALKTELHQFLADLLKLHADAKHTIHQPQSSKFRDFGLYSFVRLSLIGYSMCTVMLIGKRTLYMVWSPCYSAMCLTFIELSTLYVFSMHKERRCTAYFFHLFFFAEGKKVK